MSLLVLYQQTHREVISSTSARVSSGPVRNGEPSRVHSVLYRPMVVSASALVCPEDDWEDFDVEDEVFQLSCCCGDEGRSFGIGMQAQVSNRHELLR